MINGALVPLTRGLFAIVDMADIEMLSQYNWSASVAPENRHIYATTGGGETHIKMHQLLCPCPDGAEVDHVNGFTLDNRRINLRVATRAQNRANQRPSRTRPRKGRRGGRNGTVQASQFKGVTWYSQTRKWRAKFCINKKIIELGYFANEVEAARAYDAAAKQHHGSFAYLNFPEHQQPPTAVIATEPHRCFPPTGKTFP